MKINFWKYHGTGNDFILINGFEIDFPLFNTDLVAEMCSRHFGIGADGLIVLIPVENYDFKMMYFNSDGKPSSMCGNGARCAVSFAKFKNLILNEASFLAADGAHTAKIDDKEWVHLSMSKVEQVAKVASDFVLDTGSPHFVRIVENLDDHDIFQIGQSIRYSEPYRQDGINVNLMQVIEQDVILVETYERGVEDETRSCGTGVTACALVQMQHSNKNNISVKTKGGFLKVSSDLEEGVFTNIILSGPTKQVFEGTYISESK